MRDGIALQSRGILVLGFSCNMLKEGRDSGNTKKALSQGPIYLESSGA